MADECITTSIEYITSATLKMNKASQFQQQQQQQEEQLEHNHDVYDGGINDDDDTVGSYGLGIRYSVDRPDALGMGCGEENSNNSLPTTNGKTV